MSCYAPTRAALVVEGHGDVLAVPELIVRAAKHAGKPVFPLGNPVRAGGVKALRKAGEFERHLALAASRNEADLVLVLLDSDEECPVNLAKEFTPRCKSTSDKYNKDIKICFVVKEFESWFLCSHTSIRREQDGYWLYDDNFDNYSDIQGAKERLSKSMIDRNYKETRDQIEYAKRIDISYLIDNDRSFRKFFKNITL